MASVRHFDFYMTYHTRSMVCFSLTNFRSVEYLTIAKIWLSFKMAALRGGLSFTWS